MAFDLQKFVDLRGFVYHITDPANVPRLRRLRRIQPAAELLELAGQKELIRQRRKNKTRIVVGGETIVLKDQKPLVFANVKLASGWSEEDFVAYVNQHVYFWASDLDGPGNYGRRFRDHYREDAILRIPTAELLHANRDQVLLFCPFNAGAPRMQKGVRVSRGPDLFQPAAQFPRTAGQVVELAFRSPVWLPDKTEMSVSPGVSPTNLFVT